MPKILISMLVNLGDVIMMTSVLSLLRQKFPHYHLSVLARPEAIDLLRHNPLLDGLIIYPYKSGSPFYGFGDLLKRLKGDQYDIFLSLDLRPRAQVAAFMAGIKVRISPNILFAGARPKWQTKFLCTQLVNIEPEECEGCLVNMFQLVAQRAFNIKGEGQITLPPPSPEKIKWASDLLAPAKGPVVGLCVKTNDRRKTWPPQNFAALIAKLQEDFKPFIYITGSPDDRQYIENLLMGNSSEILNLAGETKFFDLAALAEKTDLAISPDNGAAHLMAHSGFKNLICLLVG
ncbi:MAG: glycosyltransferase family 9 protein, partial [Candidatus Adiutrix sp.]